MDDLFPVDCERLTIDTGAMLLGGFARSVDRTLLAAIAKIADSAPFRHVETPGGRRMSVAMTNTGELG